MNEIVAILKQEGILLEDPNFLEQVFSLVYKKTREVKENKLKEQEAKKPKENKENNLKNKKEVPKETLPLELLFLDCCDEELLSSKKMEKIPIQEGCSYRNYQRAKKIADLLIEEKLGLNLEVLSQIIATIKENIYSLGPDRESDAERQEHLLKALQALQKSKKLQILLSQISSPHANFQADTLIQKTLDLPSNHSLKDHDTQKAVLSAWLTYLRQNVGSCFATAPGIIIQQFQPHQLLKDFSEILATGRLNRVFNGKEFSVPLSPSSGVGDWKKPFFMGIDVKTSSTPAWLSPGVVLAFKKIGLVEDSKEEGRKVKELVGKILNNKKIKGSFFIWSVEELFNDVLLEHHELTKENLKEYNERPKNLIPSPLMTPISTSLESKSLGVEVRCTKFYENLALAKNAFNSLTENALLKSWEYTLASYAEVKGQFSKWNLYSSLGLAAEDKGGIGECIFNVLKTYLEESNRKVQEHQEQYEQIYALAKVTENRLKRAVSEKEIKWLKSEYQTRNNDLYHYQELRDQAHQKAQVLASLFDKIIDLYFSHFPEFFQEIYDADMHDMVTGPYDDSPAGFRLLYKSGRFRSSQWVLIKTPSDFIESLVGFFTLTENEMALSDQIKLVEREFREATTAIVMHIKTPEFLESSLFRMAKTHNTPIIKDPLNHLDKIDKKPWAYTSGGTMESLVSHYYKREEKPTKVARWVEHELELSVFLLETVRNFPVELIDEIEQEPEKSFLMHSPTHAFIFKPGSSPFSDGWKTNAYTYTWVRDEWILPRKIFIRSLFLNNAHMESFFEIILEKVDKKFYGIAKNLFPNASIGMRVKEFRNYLVESFIKERRLWREGTPLFSSKEIDSLLFSHLPFFPSYELRKKLEALFIKMNIERENVHTLLKIFDSSPRKQGGASMISALQLRLIARALWICFKQKAFDSENFSKKCLTAAQKLGLAFPPAIIFADTNWIKDSFGFVVNPGTEQWELWRVNSEGSVGFPMTEWRQWLDGTRQEKKWGVYNRPYEYSV